MNGMHSMPHAVAPQRAVGQPRAATARHPQSAGWMMRHGHGTQRLQQQVPAAGTGTASWRRLHRVAALASGGGRSSSSPEQQPYSQQPYSQQPAPPGAGAPHGAPPLQRGPAAPASAAAPPAASPAPPAASSAVQLAGGQHASPLPASPPGVAKTGVLLLNLGGPECLDDVKPFLYNLFADPDIIRLPSSLQFLQPALASAIATLRAPKSAAAYASIGGGSPLRAITEAQADALRAALQRRGLPGAEVYVAMRYWNPTTEEALAAVLADGVADLVILPLYPQFSISTSGSSLRLLEASFKADPALARLRHTVIPSWYQRPGYVAAMADLIMAERAQFDDPTKPVIFFSAHGVPVSYVTEAGDPYKEEMEECVGLIMAELQRRGAGNEHVLAYQSRVGPVEWLQPYTDVSIRELGARGASLLAVPISFVSEHIETLEEMDMEYRELAEESGVSGWRRVPALNTHPAFIDDLADAVLEALPYVGSIAGAPSETLVPMGDLDTLLSAYDRERRTLPPPVEPWSWGWTKSAETWNGRLAMLAIVLILLLEAVTGQPFVSKMLTSN